MPDSFGMTGIPGSNTGGTNVAVPTSGSTPTPSVGGQTNPMLPNFPSGQSTAPLTTPPPSNNNGFGTPPPLPVPGPVGLNHGGFPEGVAKALNNFIKGGAGFNPQVMQWLIAALQPQIQRGEADIMEQFSAMGLRNGSPAAIGIGDFLSQVNLNEGQIFAQMYEQSVQNYLNILLGTNQTQHPQSNTLAGLGSLIGGAGGLMGGLASMGVGAGAAGGGAAAGAAAAAAV